MAHRTQARKTKLSIDSQVRILLLTGPEQRVKQHYLKQLRTALKSVHGELQTMVHDGRTATLSEVLDDLRTFSLMQQYKLVILNEADQFLNGDTRQALERYAQSPVDHASLVLQSVRWNSPKLDTLVAKVGYKIKCEPLRGKALTSWIELLAKTQYQRKITSQAADTLIRQVGNDMGQLDGELAKLAVLVGLDETITPDLIDQINKRSSDEPAWAIQEVVINALLAVEAHVSAGKAIDKLHEIVDQSGHPDVVVAYYTADLMRNVYLAIKAKQQGASSSEISRSFKLWGPRQALLRHLDESTAARLFDRIVNLDVRSKSGLGKPMQNLECFLGCLADERGGRHAAR